MSALKIRPWPFSKNEIAELFWFNSPYMNSENNWVFSVAFQGEDNAIKDIILPWGTLPYLILGQKYRDGLPIGTELKGSIGKIINRNITSTIEICDAFEMPYSLYYLYKNHNYGRQKLCKFRTHNMQFYVPCIEIIRSILAPNKTLAYHLLRPNGMDLLIDNISVPNKDTINIDLSIDYPANIADEEEAAHLAWLKTNKYAKVAWDSVYMNMYRSAIGVEPNSIQKAFSKRIPIEAKPPFDAYKGFNYRGISKADGTLVLEIIDLWGLTIDYSFIKYSHPAFNKKEKTDESKRTRKVGSSSKAGNDYEMDESSETTKKNSNEKPLIDKKHKYAFDRYLLIKKNRNSSANRKTEMNIENKVIDQNEGNGLRKVGTQDHAHGSRINPIEFKTLDIIKDQYVDGLEEFIKTVDYINSRNLSIDINMSIILLPEGKPFSYYPDGRKRNCAIVRIQKQGKMPSFIIEIGRADNWSISTLVFNFLDNLSDLKYYELLIKNLLEGLMAYNGHWDKLFIEKIITHKFYFIKHIEKQTMKCRAEKVIEKIF